jgi:hypothetical protein
MKRIALIAFTLFMFSLSSTSQTTTDINYLKSKQVYGQLYSFIDTSANYIQYFSSEAMKTFFDKLKTTSSEKVKILHIGDSHLQADIGANCSRVLLQDVFGFGGRGAIFPYTIAKTHATVDYEVKGYGLWERTRNIEKDPVLDLGISGITARTYDSSAGFEIQFYPDRAKIQSNFTRLKLFCHTGPNSFNCQYRLSNQEEWTTISCSVVPNNRSCIEINLPHAPSSIYMRVLKSDTAQKFFEIYGLSLESTENKGLLYNSVGINGARLNSFLKEKLYETQISEFNPDLVIVDLIANDLAYGEFNQAQTEKDLKDCLKKIRTSSPKASIMLVGMQDIYVEGRNVVNAGLYSSFLRQFAALNNVSFYDYYTVSGGARSMKKWLARGLSSKDMCHLTTVGYNLKGQLFINAILGSYMFYLKNESAPLTVIEKKIDPKEIEKPEVIKPVPTEKKLQSQGSLNKKPTVKKEKSITHIVKKGETLSTIANKFKTTPAKIKAINYLKTNNLRVGQAIKIN